MARGDDPSIKHICPEYFTAMVWIFDHGNFTAILSINHDRQVAGNFTPVPVLRSNKALTIRCPGGGGGGGGGGVYRIEKNNCAL